MGRIADQKFVCLDCEATGLEPKEDSIIELAVVKFDFNRSYVGYETLVNPECLISEESQAIHRISQKMVSASPTIREVLPKFLELIGDHIIVGHSIQFDIEILNEAAKRSGIPCQITKNKFIDTLRLARLYGDCPTNSLEYLRQHFNIEGGVAHRAMSDVIVNIEVFKRLVEPYPTIEKVFEALAKPILLKEMPLGKHKGRPFKEIPSEYLQWAAGKNFDNDLLFSIRLELKKRKNGNLFSQATNPFQGL